eukprot:gnl/TRDRNA2_/TRDRNA2_116333_c0_seq1.p1 gnl/TRDRNA2_/TRDRNA2_116333_c0~~gnl/TRDRNA2_/TRDRNA2_116333_c0_seq1.p1  ORF type:complete len:144 (+),score=21.92 gnl/TRDRNA2_/TRDRNA2_116333_c0_seq1:30-434(+)
MTLEMVRTANSIGSNRLRAMPAQDWLFDTPQLPMRNFTSPPSTSHTMPKQNDTLSGFDDSELRPFDGIMQNPFKMQMPTRQPPFPDVSKLKFLRVFAKDEPAQYSTTDPAIAVDHKSGGTTNTDDVSVLQSNSR